MRSKHKEKREAKKKQANPMNDDQKKKLPIPVKMKYAEQEEGGVYLRIRKVGHHDEQDKDEMGASGKDQTLSDAHRVEERY